MDKVNYISSMPDSDQLLRRKENNVNKSKLSNDFKKPLLNKSKEILDMANDI